MRSLFSNPEALQAMMQIQQGMQRLQTAVPPEVLSNLGFMGFPTMPTSAPAANTTPTTTTSSSTNSSTTPQTNRPSMPGQPSSNYFSQMLNMMSNNTLVSTLLTFLFTA